MDVDKYKIVCIVQNNISYPSKGLNHVFNKKENYFIRKFIYKKINDEFITNFGYNRSKKSNFLLINKEEGVNPMIDIPKENEDWDILFVCDNFFDNLEQFPKYFFNENTLIMYHSKPNFNEEELNRLGLKKYKYSEHEALPSKGYFHLFELTAAYNDDGTFDKDKYNIARQEIIKWFGVNDKLNAALEFLHKCLSKESFPTNLSILSKKGFSDMDLGKKNVNGSVKSCFKNLEEIYNNGNEEEYTLSLSNLRHAVLKKV